MKIKLPFITIEVQMRHDYVKAYFYFVEVRSRNNNTLVLGTNVLATSRSRAIANIKQMHKHEYYFSNKFAKYTARVNTAMSKGV